MSEDAIAVAGAGQWLHFPFDWKWDAATADAIPFRQIVDRLPQCIFWKNGAGMFLGCNLAGAQALGLSRPDDIRGKTDFDFHLDLATADYLRREDDRVMRNGIPILRHLSRGSGEAESARWYETSKVPLRDARGSVIGLLISYDDVTERQRMLEALRASNERLEQAEAGLVDLNASLERRMQEAVAKAIEQEGLVVQQARYAAMGEMVGAIAHQWRQPLTTLGLLLQNIQYDAQEESIAPAELTDKLTQAFRLIEQMSATVDDFRNFFRPADTDVDMDVVACVGDALALMDASLRHAGVAVVVKADASWLVTGRPNELRQVILNLVSNAKDALIEHRATDRRIWIEVAGGDGEVTLRERNNGGCIPQERLSRLFDPYFTTKDDGTGLGLYITRQIVVGHFHGSIACANVGDDAAEFVIRLPLAAASGRTTEGGDHSIVAEAVC